MVRGGTLGGGGRVEISRDILSVFGVSPVVYFGFSFFLLSLYFCWYFFLFACFSPFFLFDSLAHYPLCIFLSFFF